jgi:hypothetical protein
MEGCLDLGPCEHVSRNPEEGFTTEGTELHGVKMEQDDFEPGRDIQCRSQQNVSTSSVSETNIP